jgi:hypothetical protein
MKRSAIFGFQFRPDCANLGAEVPTAPYSINWHTKTPPSNGHGTRWSGQSHDLVRGHLLVANLLPMIEIDTEFEELEEKAAPQSDTSYVESVFPVR